MTVYSVSYDLNKTGQNYDGLITEIKTFNDYEKIMKSHWFIYYNGTAEQVYNKLSKHLDNNDHMLISEVNQSYYGFLSQSVWDWLKKYL
jgi:hypothetical protein